MMTWRNLLAPASALVAHGLLLCFTVFLVLKLDGIFSPSWWIVFLPLWIFHAVLARVRFSLPAPIRIDRHRGPLHSIVAAPLFVAFEVLLCFYLQSLKDYGEPILNIQWVILPFAAWQLIVLFDNIRRFINLLPKEGQYLPPEAFSESIPYLSVGFGMLFMLFATVTAISIFSNEHGPEPGNKWSDFCCYIGGALLYVFLVWTKSIHYLFIDKEREILYLSEDEKLNGVSKFKDYLTGFIVTILFISFDILLYIRLEGVSESQMQACIIFIPIFILQIAGVLLGIWRLIENIIILFHNSHRPFSEGYISFASKIQDYFMFLHNGSRVIGWWSINEESREEQARLCYLNQNMGYNTFCSYPPERVNHMPRTLLINEVERLQTSLGEQTEIARDSKEKFERLQNEKISCRICYAQEISTVLLPCRHHVLCMYCAERCTKCPICRQSIKDRMLIYDVNTAT